MRKQRALASVRTVSAVPPRPVPLGDSTGREVLLAAVADVGGIQFITVAANLPDERNSVLRVLQKMHATSRNLLFASENTAALQAAFDPAWESAVPYTVLIAPDGKVLYKKQGSVDMLELRRTILANLPSDDEGFNKYWLGQSIDHRTFRHNHTPLTGPSIGGDTPGKSKSRHDEKVLHSSIIV